MHSPIQDITSLMAGFDRLGYVIEEELATVVYLSLKLGKPILVEGNQELDSDLWIINRFHFGATDDECASDCRRYCRLWNFSDGNRRN